MTFFYEYIPNIPELPIIIIEAENYKDSNRRLKQILNIEFTDKNQFGFIWMAQTKQSPNFDIPTHLEQYPIYDLVNSISTFKIVYLDNTIETIQKKV